MSEPSADERALDPSTRADLENVRRLCESAGYGFTIAESARMWAEKTWGLTSMGEWLVSLGKEFKAAGKARSETRWRMKTMNRTIMICVCVLACESAIDSPPSAGERLRARGASERNARRAAGRARRTLSVGWPLRLARVRAWNLERSLALAGMAFNAGHRRGWCAGRGLTYPPSAERGGS